MSSPSDPRSPGEQADEAQPSTREIPVVTPAAAAPPLPPHPGVFTPTPVSGPGTAPAAAVEGPQPTGPVDFVPGLGTPPPPPPPPVAAPVPAESAPTVAATWPDTLESDGTTGEKSATPRAPRDRAQLIGLALAVLGLVLLEVGLALGFGGASLWSATPLWSAFATIAALVALLAFVPSPPSADGGGAAAPTRIALGGLAGLAVFWLLVVLADAASNRGFVLTAAVACLGAGFWLGRSAKA